MIKAFSMLHEQPVKEALREAVKQLQAARIETASLDARVLLEHVLGISREQLLLAFDDVMTPKEEQAYQAIIAERAKRRPVAQLIGKREFWGMDFIVTEDTLTPRPDSETLVEAVLANVKDKAAPLKILDLGTGTGCLLLSLLKELPNASGMGVDASPKALSVARENAKNLEFSLRARFRINDWCQGLGETFDIVVANPPYIATTDILGLEPEVAQFEPKLALDGGADGLKAYRDVVAALPPVLAAEAIVGFEVGAGQHAALAEIAAGQGFAVKEMRQDLQGVMRAVLIHQR